MSEVVQQLVDELSAKLNRSVEADDLGLLPIAVSAQRGALDDVRINAVLQRRSGADVVAHVASYGIRTATAPVRFPANERLATLPRLCVPIRDAGGGRWGYLWLIDADPPISDHELSTAVDTASAIAAELSGAAHATTAELTADRQLVADLLGDDAQRRCEAAEQVKGDGRLPSGEPLTVLASRLAGCADVAAAVPKLIAARSTGQALLGWADDHVLLVGAAALVDARLSMLLRSLDATAARQSFRVVGTGLGQCVHSFDALPESCRGAWYAARVAAADPARGGFARWSQLGPDLAFYGLPWNIESVESLHHGASRLLDPAHAVIAETVLTYLGCGCDTAICVARLAIHRTTLYYRLRRAGEVLGHAWDGDIDRLGLQLALRLGRLLAHDR